MSAHLDIACAAQERRDEIRIAFRQNYPRSKRPRGDTRFPGISRHARELGVNRVSLYLVLTGQRQAAGLKERYEMQARAERNSRA